MKKLFFMVAVALMTVACSNDDVTKNTTDPEVCPGTLELTRGEQMMVGQSNDFAFRLAQLGLEEGQNQMLSPISITYALAMLNNGATGQTQQQICQVLGFQDVEAANVFCQKMLTAAPQLDPNTQVKIANTIFMNKGYSLKPAFIEKASKYYLAEPQTLDFHDGQTLNIINQWASDHTEKMIDKVLTENTFDPNAVSYLLNAIYFKGEWASKFDKNNTFNELFVTTGKELPTMHQQGAFTYAETDELQALQLPYGNGAYVMTLLLPRPDKSLSSVLENLTAENWKTISSSMSLVDVDIKLPTFETQTDKDLKDIMKALGMTDAFDDRKAMFPEFCNEETTYIECMYQSSHIKVNEEGAEAAAVTTIGMTNKAEIYNIPFYATRPFLYIISQQSTGAIFFIGQFVG